MSLESITCSQILGFLLCPRKAQSLPRCWWLQPSRRSPPGLRRHHALMCRNWCYWWLLLHTRSKQEWIKLLNYLFNDFKWASTKPRDSVLRWPHSSCKTKMFTNVNLAWCNIRQPVRWSMWLPVTCAPQVELRWH